VTGIYWSDFWKLIKTHAHPSTVLTLYGPNRTYPTKIDIYDRNLPRRKGRANQHNQEAVTLLGDPEYDHWRDSFVCSTSFHNGSIPLKSKVAFLDSGHRLDHANTTKGVVDTINQLLTDGCLVRSEELERWLRKASTGRL
jgi:hypothetical protein